MVIIIFVIILIILIILFILLKINKKIEKFVNYSHNNVLFNLTPDEADINKFELVSNINNVIIVTKKIILYGLPVYIYENVDMPNSDSIYTVFSSFVFNINSPNSRGRSLLSTTKSVLPLSVPLKDNGFLSKYGFNYIFFNFPDEIKTNIFTRIEITFANSGGYDASNFNILSFNNSSINSKITLDTLIRIPINRLNTGISQKITFDVYSEFTMENLNLILIISRLTEIDISSIKIYFKNPIVEHDSRQDVVISPKISLNTISTNENEQIDIVGLDIFNTRKEDDAETGNLYSSFGITQNINLLTKLRIPWCIYDANSVYQNNSSVIIEQLKGGCRNAKIIGKSSIEKDNIYYIKGNINTSIEFPDDCMPKTYTICAITKYENENANKLEVLKTLNNPKIVIGHSQNIRGIVTKNDGRGDINYTNEASADFKTKQINEWVITCIKSTGKDVKKTIIINNEKRGSKQLGFLTQNNKLGINSNGLDKRNCSEFGFAYMIIWDQLLSDNELVMVSNILNIYVNDTSKKIDIDRNLITIKDGLSEDRAADSAVDIMRNFCIKNNGRYWIKSPDATVAEYIYCIMDEKCKGGGWMLAMKGSKYNNKTFNYNAEHWTKATTVIPTRGSGDYDIEPNSEFMETELDAKYNIYNTMKVKECLAIFDPRDCGVENKPEYYYNMYQLKKYGWIWHEKNFNNGIGITLLDFYRSNKKQFYYSTPTTTNELSLKNFMNSYYDNKYVNFLRFNTNSEDSLPRFKHTIIFDTTQDYFFTIFFPDSKGPCNLKIWSSQNQFYSFGFNVGPVVANEASRGNWPHRVRWGCSFNENDDSKPTTNDVSGGIGMECRDYSAGDAIGCCQNTVGQNKNFSFKWFIR
jgi:hypothetical protein